jgi:hypothetical protein
VTNQNRKIGKNGYLVRCKKTEGLKDVNDNLNKRQINMTNQNRKGTKNGYLMMMMFT